MSDIQILMLKALLLAGVWLAMWLAHKAHCVVYRWMTRGWVPIDKDTAWLAAQGYPVAYPPNPLGAITAGVMLSIAIAVLQ